MKEAFTYQRVAGKVIMMIENANAILEEYAANGYVMTLRMLHYQFVSRQLYANTVNNYKKLGHAMNVGRRMGLVDWDHLEDTIRGWDELSTWSNPNDILYDASRWYHRDIWEDQAYAPEVWIEKDALSVVFRRACRDFRVPLFACRGYVSASAQYRGSKRFQDYIGTGRTPIVFHFGDHDPSGMDMTRDNRETFELLTGEPVEVRRLALNMDQVRKYEPPPNPAKTTDSRYGRYRQRFGGQSWELDALAPNVLDDMVREAVKPLIDTHRWQASLDQEAIDKKRLELIADHYDTIVERLEEDND